MAAADEGADEGSYGTAEVVHRILTDSGYYRLHLELDREVHTLLAQAYQQGRLDATERGHESANAAAALAYRQGRQAAVEAQREAFNTALAGLIGERP